MQTMIFYEPTVNAKINLYVSYMTYWSDRKTFFADFTVTVDNNQSKFRENTSSNKKVYQTSIGFWSISLYGTYSSKIVPLFLKIAYAKFHEDI